MWDWFCIAHNRGKKMNPAERVLLHYSKLKGKKTEDLKFESVCKNFGLLDHSATGICRIITSLYEAVAKLEDEIHKKHKGSAKYDLYVKNLNLIRSPLKTISVHSDSQMFSMGIPGEVFIVLEHIAADLADTEKNWTIDEVNTFFRTISGLQDEVAESGLEDGLRLFLLDLIVAMKAAVEEYRLRGIDGVEEQLKLILGSLMVKYEMKERIQKDAPAIWKGILDVSTILANVVAVSQDERVQSLGSAIVQRIAG